MTPLLSAVALLILALLTGRRLRVAIDDAARLDRRLGELSKGA